MGADCHHCPQLQGSWAGQPGLSLVGVLLNSCQPSGALGGLLSTLGTYLLCISTPGLVRVSMALPCGGSWRGGGLPHSPLVLIPSLKAVENVRLLAAAAAAALLGP